MKRTDLKCMLEFKCMVKYVPVPRLRQGNGCGRGDGWINQGMVWQHGHELVPVLHEADFGD